MTEHRLYSRKTRLKKLARLFKQLDRINAQLAENAFSKESHKRVAESKATILREAILEARKALGI
jgi:hypothetical protein